MWNSFRNIFIRKWNWNRSVHSNCLDLHYSFVELDEFSELNIDLQWGLREVNWNLPLKPLYQFIDFQQERRQEMLYVMIKMTCLLYVNEYCHKVLDFKTSKGIN